MFKLVCSLSSSLCLSGCASHFQRADDQACKSYGAQPGTQVVCSMPPSPKLLASACNTEGRNSCEAVHF